MIPLLFLALLAGLGRDRDVLVGDRKKIEDARRTLDEAQRLRDELAEIQREAIEGGAEMELFDRIARLRGDLPRRATCQQSFGAWAARSIACECCGAGA